MLPVGVEFFSDDHAKGGLDALTDLRGFGIDGNRIIGSDADEGVHRLSCVVIGCRVADRLGRERRVSEAETQHQSRDTRAGELEQRAPFDCERRIRSRYGMDLAYQR